MLAENLGELAALGTAGCWVVSALAFEAAGERIGSLVLNFVRLVVTALLLAAYGAIARGAPLPTDATAFQWQWLGLSAVIGFVVGDYLLFRAFIVLGPRLSTLMMATTPLWVALISWIGLGEAMDTRDIGGMVLIVAGIAWALSEREQTGKRATAAGTALAIGGALGQAGGLVLSKYGMGDYDPFAATQIRVLVGTVSFAAIVTLAGAWGSVRRALPDRRAMRMSALGAVFGPFLGVGLSLAAVQLARSTGVAASLMATTPILMVPVVRMRGERSGAGGLGGAVLAVLGASVLLLG